jgi:hypothetical protein
MKRRLIVSGVMLALLLAACFVPMRFGVNRAFWERIMDAGHLPLMAGFTWIVFRLFRGQAASYNGRSVVWAALTSCAAGGVIEGLQPWFGRTDSLVDFRNGVLGSVLAALGITAWEGNRQAKASCALAMAASILLALWPAGQEGHALFRRWQQFPMLGDFENDAELRLWPAQGGTVQTGTTVARTHSHQAHGDFALQINAVAGSWSGVSFLAGNQDWRPYKQLAWDIFNPGPPFTLSLRVDDDGDCTKFGSRFDDGYAVTNGWNHLRVTTRVLERGPRDRPLNLSGIRRLVLFTGEKEPARQFYLDHVRLE